MFAAILRLLPGLTRPSRRAVISSEGVVTKKGARSGSRLSLGSRTFCPGGTATSSTSVPTVEALKARTFKLREFFHRVPLSRRRAAEFSNQKIPASSRGMLGQKGIWGPLHFSDHLLPATTAPGLSLLPGGKAEPAIASASENKMGADAHDGARAADRAQSAAR